MISPPPMPEPLVRSYSGQPVKPGLFLMIRGSRLTMSAIEVIVDGSTYGAAVDSAYFPALALAPSRTNTGFRAVALALAGSCGSSSPRHRGEVSLAATVPLDEPRERN